MKWLIISCLVIIIGRQLNILYYPSVSWAGDWLPVPFGYYASAGDLLQFAGLFAYAWLVVFYSQRPATIQRGVQTSRY